MRRSRSRARRRRPLGVIILAVVQLAYAVGATAGLVSPRDVRVLHVLPDALAPVEAIIAAGIAVELWSLRRWAWIATMLWTGIGLAGALVAYAQGDARYGQMVLGVLAVFYLNQREVQDAFHHAVQTVSPEPPA